MLFTIARAVKDRLATIDRVAHQRELEKRLGDCPASPSFRDALAQPGASFIFEIKRTSPSASHNVVALDVTEIANLYSKSGASAISVLTEPDFFSGSLDDLQTARQVVELPLLRKDFIIDPVQMLEAKVHGASAALLIVALLSDRQLVDLQLVAQELGLDVLVEVHTEHELERALQSGAHIIGVNNRDLTTLEIDLQTGENLLSKIPSEYIKVAESGLSTHDDVVRMQKAGADAFLIGTAVVRSDDPAIAIREIMAS